MRSGIALAAVLVSVAWAAPARAALTVAERSPDRGWIGLRISGGVPRALVTVREGDSLLTRIRLDARGAGGAKHAAAWRCDPRIRTLTVADRRGHAAELTAETPRCDGRIAVRAVPRRPRAGRRMAIRLSDRWQLGGLDVCLALVAPGGAGECRPARLARRGAALHLRAPRPGRWTIELRGAGFATARPLDIRPRRGRLAVLATGDSMMAPVARSLQPLLDATGVVRVRKDVHYGAGISSSFVLDWLEHAHDSAARWRPDVVVLFIGGHEGWPFGTVECCGPAWVTRYAERARAIAAAYRRRGAAQVYVLNVPAPAEASRTLPLSAVNAGLVQAVAELGPGVRLLDMSAIFTPGFVYRSAMPVGGVLTVVRETDGVHLTHAGGTIAAQAIVAALVQDAVFGPVTSAGDR